MKEKTAIRITFRDEEMALRAFEAADGMIRIACSPRVYNGTVLTEDGEIRNMRLGERFLYFGRKARLCDPLKDHPDCALSSLALKGRTLTLGDCSDLQGSMNIGMACESEFFLQLLFTIVILFPEGSFEGTCLYENPGSGRREETAAVCKDGSLVCRQTFTDPSEDTSRVFAEEAEWLLKEGRLVRNKGAS
ncbi:MAG: hypothetical protein IKI23_04305 [Lachnospiraceae bacterium]|nr:hypothetical protein [Lachnospiraceae bacterium]